MLKNSGKSTRFNYDIHKCILIVRALSKMAGRPNWEDYVESVAGFFQHIRFNP